MSKLFLTPKILSVKILMLYSINLQGVYTFNMKTPAIQVDTFSVHGGPDGYITAIRGKVKCLLEEDLVKNEIDLANQEMIKEKCYFRFPTFMKILFNLIYSVGTNI